MFDALRSLIPGEGETTVIRECRNCGSSLEKSTEICPSCGHDEVALYELP